MSWITPRLSDDNHHQGVDRYQSGGKEKLLACSFGSVLTSGVIGLLTGPHHTSFSEPGSFTIRLSRGDRPVLVPEYAVNAPVDVMAEPVSYTRASSYSAATEGLPICRNVSFCKSTDEGEKGHEQWRHGRSRCGQFRGVPPPVRCVPARVWRKPMVS